MLPWLGARHVPGIGYFIAKVFILCLTFTTWTMSVNRSGGLPADSPESSYLNHKVIQYVDTWETDDQDATRSTHDIVIATRGGADRGLITFVDLDRPDDHLIEIHGIAILVSDPTAEGDDIKFDIFVYNNTESAPTVASFVDRMGEKGDELIAHSSWAVNDAAGTNGGPHNIFWYPEPILSTGKMVVDHQMGSEDDELGGEIATVVYYDFVEVGDREVLNQLLQVT